MSRDNYWLLVHCQVQQDVSVVLCNQGVGEG